MAIKDDMQDVQEAVINELITENGITNTLADGQVTPAKLSNNSTLAWGQGSIGIGKSEYSGQYNAGIEINPDLSSGETGIAYVDFHSTGATSPDYDGRIQHTNNEFKFKVNDGTDVLTISNGRISGSTFRAAQGVPNDADNSTVGFAFGADGDTGMFSVGTGEAAGGPIAFYTNNVERARIDSNGNLLVGKTTTSTANQGIQINPSGRIDSTSDGAEALRLNRKTSDGEIINFRKDNTTVGSISSRGGVATNLILRTATNQGAGIGGANSGVLPCDEEGLQDAEINLGSSGTRWKDLYLSGTIILSNVPTSSAGLPSGAIYSDGGTLKIV